MTNGENMANILLQRLVRELNKLWPGQPSEIKTAADAYEVCRTIVEEVNNTAVSGEERTQWRIK